MFPPDQTAELSTPNGRKPPRADVATAVDSMVDGRSEYVEPAKVGVWEEGAIINDRYTLERRLGSGSMGEVFLARDRLLKKHVALKVLRSDLAKSRATVRRFLREVALAHSVTHPNVVRIHDTGEADGLPYFSMEHLQGQTLDELIEASRLEASSDNVDPDEVGDPPMTLREIREVSYEILSGLAAAHEAGIVHRDLKPANVMLTHRGAIVMDFGVAGLDAPAQTVRPNPSEARSLVRTEAGTIFGSPAYMAPELWEGAPATVQSDLYSFGVMLYQMLSGRLPIEAPNAKAFLVKLREEKPPPIRQLRKDTPWTMALLVSRCMAREPEDRPVSAEAAATLVAPLAKRWRWLIGAVVIGLAVLAGSLLFGARSHTEHLDMGLPDPVAVADLRAFVRSFDVGDYEAATRQIERLETRAPDSAAVVFWRATFEHELGDEPSRLIHCREAGYDPDQDGGQWAGDELWRELATRACADDYTPAGPLRSLLDPDEASKLPDTWLPLAVYESLIPRLEATREPSNALLREADEALRRLDDVPEFNEGPPLALRWQLARVDLRLALGLVDEARLTLDELRDEHPEAPVVLARSAHFYAIIGERESAASWAEAIVHYDPRPALRMLLDQGRLRDAAALMDRYALSRGPHPHQQALVEMWCGYAYRFEIEPAPARCGAIQPGLVHSLWVRGRSSGADLRAMSALEKAINSQQRAINQNECLRRGDNASILTQAAPPFETYLRQLDIWTALCEGTDAGNRHAKRLAEGLVALTPDDPWALVLDARVDEAIGAMGPARDKRRQAAERWTNADPELPLVRNVRELVGIPPDGEGAAPEDEDAERSEPTLMTPADAAEGDIEGELLEAGDGAMEAVDAQIESARVLIDPEAVGADEGPAADDDDDDGGEDPPGGGTP